MVNPLVHYFLHFIHHLCPACCSDGLVFYFYFFVNLSLSFFDTGTGNAVNRVLLEEGELQETRHKAVDSGRGKMKGRTQQGLRRSLEVAVTSQLGVLVC